MTTLYAISKNGLQPVQRATLESEAMLEDWIFEDPSIMGLDVLVIGRQVTTYNQGRIDILAMERSGDLVIIELKRSRTPRDVVAQTLDYASWVVNLTTRDVHDIARDSIGQPLGEVFQKHFNESLPEDLNSDHSMVIVASEFDSSSKRIVEYLAERHGLKINSTFFAVFEQNGEKFLATEWLMDQQEVVERADSKTGAPWTGYYYVNAGHGEYRSWEDMQRYGFISAGTNLHSSKQLKNLDVGSPIYVFQRDHGYLGFGVVTTKSVMAKDFYFSGGQFDGQKFSDIKLEQPNLLHDSEDFELSEYIVAVEWKKTFPIGEGKTSDATRGYRSIVCKLRNREALDFLAREFGTID